MRKIIILTAIAIVLIVQACTNSQPLEPNVREFQVKDTGKINFEKLAVGQSSRYLLTKIREPQTDYENINLYTGDTLVLEVYDKKGSTYIFRETLRKNANPDFTDSLGVDSREWNNGRTITYEVTMQGDSVSFDDPYNDYIKTFMFQSYYNLILPLNDISDTIISPDIWRTLKERKNSNINGYILNYTLLGKKYDKLSIFENNEVSVMFYMQIAPQIYIYSKEYGIVRVITYSSALELSNSGIAYGWDLIP